MASTTYRRGLRDVRCAAESWLDYRKVCVVTLEPGEFTQLTANLSLERTEYSQKMYNPQHSMYLGRAFPIANCYRRIGESWNINNSHFRSYELFADANHRFVVMNYVADQFCNRTHFHQHININSDRYAYHNSPCNRR